MKLRALLIIGGTLLAGTLTAQTLTDVINEFNTGVEKVNNQEYEVSIEHFNQVINYGRHCRRRSQRHEGER